MSSQETNMGPRIDGLAPTIFKNTTLSFNSEGVKVKVSVNITPAMSRIMSPNNVFRGPEGIYIYLLQKQLKGPQITARGIELTQEILLNRCMALARKAKLQLITNKTDKINKNIDLLMAQSKKMGIKFK